jgi:hypothetical protein
MVAFADMGSPALVDATSASVPYPQFSPGAVPPSYPAGPIGLDIFIALLAELRVLNAQLNFEMGASAPDLTALRADAVFDLTLGQGVPS